jgi:hypothetical protein
MTNTVPVNFADMRAMLQHIGKVMGEGYLISCSWSDDVLRVCVGVRDSGDGTWRRPWCLTFDSPDDYAANPYALIAELVSGAKAWFSQKDQIS